MGYIQKYMKKKRTLIRQTDMLRDNNSYVRSMWKAKLRVDEVRANKDLMKGNIAEGRRMAKKDKSAIGKLARTFKDFHAKDFPYQAEVAFGKNATEEDLLGPSERPKEEPKVVLDDDGDLKQDEESADDGSENAAAEKGDEDEEQWSASDNDWDT